MAGARLLIVGGGRMGGALAGGLISLSSKISDIAGTMAVVEPSERARSLLMARHPRLVVLDDVAAAAGASDVGKGSLDVVLAVKPKDTKAACVALAPFAPRRFLSIVAGVTTSLLEGWIGASVPVVRAMPNTPALVRSGISAIAPGRYASDSDLSWAESILGAVGEVVRVPEGMIDAVTGLSGSGPAYVFLLAQAMVDAGIAAGLSRDVSCNLAFHTINGAGRMLLELPDGPEKLRDDVTSPGGTTAAGLRVLELRSVRSAIVEAVLAARDRSAELGHEPAPE